LQKGFKEDSFMNLKIDSVEAKNIILLIDEGEITLHPNWQKEYIKFLIHFLKDNFHQNLHLILTSHSPFILSDIPKEHIIFLEKGKQVYPFKESEQTFGTNIHTLLSHGFFMNKGLVGEFAKEKIQYVINILNEEIPNIEKSDEMQHIISCIGEQFLKKKLQQKYDDVFLDEIARNEKIVLLERQIERLKNVKH
jgi:predicted ATP-binding protein involved in virulence